MQSTVVLSYISGRGIDGSLLAESRDFGSHVREYINRDGELSEKQRIFEANIDAWLARSNAQTRRTITFAQSLDSKEVLEARESELAGGPQHVGNREEK